MKQEPEWQNKNILRSFYAQFCEFSLYIRAFTEQTILK